MTRPAGNGFSWAEASGANVAVPVQSLVDLGYAPGSPAESLTLNDGLRVLGLWTQLLAASSTDLGSGTWSLGAAQARFGSYRNPAGSGDGVLVLAPSAGVGATLTGTGDFVVGLAPKAVDLNGPTGDDWQAWGYRERTAPSGGATAYPTLTYDLSPGLGRWRPRLAANPNILLQSAAASNGVDLRHQSSSGAQQQQWRVGLPPMPHFSRSAVMTLSDVEVDVSFAADTTASSTVTATLYRYDGTSGTMTVVASGSVSGTGAGASSDTITLVAAGHTVVAAEGTNYVLDVFVEVENTGADFVIAINRARMTLAKTGIE